MASCYLVGSLLLLVLVAAVWSQEAGVYDFTKIAQNIAGQAKAECYKNVDKDPAYPKLDGCGCDYPLEMCFWYVEDKGNGIKVPKENCYELSQECQDKLKNLEDVDSGSSTTAAGGDETTTAASGDGSTTSGSSADSSTSASADGADSATTGATDGAAGGGKDWHKFCCFWANAGECDKNPFFMRTVCQKSCGTVGCTVEKAQSCPVSVNTNGCPWQKMGTGNGGSTATGGGGGGGGSPPAFANNDLHKFCGFWASKGECQKNPAFMTPMCKKSCAGRR